MTSPVLYLTHLQSVFSNCKAVFSPTPNQFSADHSGPLVPQIQFFFFNYSFFKKKYFYVLSFIVVVFNLFNLFYFWLRWVFVAARRLSLVAVSRGYFSLRCMGFSLRWLLLLRSMGSGHVGFSSCGLWALQCRLSSCGSRAQLLRCMWDLPGPGLEPMSPALAGDS